MRVYLRAITMHIIASHKSAPMQKMTAKQQVQRLLGFWQGPARESQLAPHKSEKNRNKGNAQGLVQDSVEVAQGAAWPLRCGWELDLNF